MKKILFAAAALALSGGMASAADAVPGCSDEWSGFYVGAHAGYGFGDTDTTGGAIAVGDVDIDGFMGGVLGGYNFQDCDWVYGVESDVGFGEIDGSDGAIDDTDLEPTGHIRARIGSVYNGMLLFGAAGLAIGDFDIRVPGVGNDSEAQFGLTVGGGVDYAIDPNWLIRAEYLFDYYGESTFNYGVAGTIKNDAYINTFRAAVMYKF